ncbi:MAG TPA: hypothetical protein VMQ51_03175 [Candidatus Binatia bacterium]|nr:hypothetical protein [Candidatus Binatia bacterium]
MKLAFSIGAPNHYRLLGPVIDRALARGWKVECWQDGDQKIKRRFGAWGRTPVPPVFRCGDPTIREYGRGRAFAELLSAFRPDVVIALRRPRGAAPDGHTRWLGLQYTLNIWEFIDESGNTPFDAVGVHTEYWRARAADSLRILMANQGRSPVQVDDRAIERTMLKRGTVVGFPQMDQLQHADGRALRRRLGIEGGRPVVLYCPFPFNSNPRTFWVRHIYGASRLHQRLAVRLPAGRRYACHVENRWDDRSVVDAVRAFCDANGAVLIVKQRAKDPVPGYLRRAADRIVRDHAAASDYPSKLLELMSIASLCFHFFSTVAYEAAYAGVPSVCITADGNDLGFASIWQEWFLSETAGSSFNFPGVTYPMRIPDIVRELPMRRLADFPVEPAARAQYLEKFIGADDGKASDRLLDVATALVESAR